MLRIRPLLPPATMMWSTQGIPIRFPASMTRRVMAISSAEGVRSPDGWLCRTRKDEELERMPLTSRLGILAIVDVRSPTLTILKLIGFRWLFRFTTTRTSRSYWESSFFMTSTAASGVSICRSEYRWLPSARRTLTSFILYFLAVTSFAILFLLKYQPDDLVIIHALDHPVDLFQGFICYIWHSIPPSGGRGVSRPAFYISSSSSYPSFSGSSSSSSNASEKSYSSS